MQTEVNAQTAQPAVAPQTEAQPAPQVATPMVPYQSASLYVGDLLPTVSEAILYDLFNAVGPVASVRICRDAVTKKSLGYAYVNFHTPTDAEKALDTLNYNLIKGKPCRIMWSQRDPALRKNGEGNVFIKHLHPSIDNKALYDTFSLFGNILSCKVVTDQNGKSRGYGFVHFETVKAADEAINRINGMLISGQEVFVGRFLKKQDRPIAREWTNLYVKNLPRDFTEDDLKELFGKHGEISSLTIMKGEDGVSRGFGFVDFKTHDAAVKAVESLNDFEVQPKNIEAPKEDEATKENEDGDNAEKAEEAKVYKLEVCKAQKKSDRVRELTRKFENLKVERQAKYQNVNVYIKNLDESVDEAMLQKEFEPYGTITSVKIMKQGNVSKGFGFVCFSTPDEALAAIQNVNGHMLAGKPMYVALAQRKEQRKLHLEAQHRNQHRMMMMGHGVGNMVGVNPGAVSMGNQVGLNQGPMGMNPGMMMNMVPQQQSQQMNQIPMNYYNMGMMQQQQQMQQLQGRMESEPLDPATLAGATQEQRKKMIGEKLFALVQQLNPPLAPKITGMLLEVDNTELLHIMESPALLQARVSEAIQVLHGAGELKN